MRRSLAVVTLAALLAACAHGNGWVAERLFCGRGIPGGGTVSDAEWTTFLAEVVTPRFPDGLTVWRAEGQWRDPQGIVHEPVMVIEILHHGEPAARAAVGAIAAEYQRRFHQNAVLRVTEPVHAVFVTE
jgi:hypothetical protein